MLRFDLIIVGGGLVGASLAHCLSASGLKILVIDQQSAADLCSNRLDNRGLALTYSSIKILEKLQLWQDIKPASYPIQSVHVSEQSSFGYTILDAKRYNLAALGYVVGAGTLGSALINSLSELANITVLRPTRVTNLNFDKNTSLWELQLGKQTYHCKLLVAADGTNSYVRKVLNIGYFEQTYNQSAIVANIITDLSHANRAYERFTKRGVLALLPFGDKRMKCVLTIDNQCLSELQHASDAEFCSRLQDMFGLRLGRITEVKDRKVFPIQNCTADVLYANNCVLIGNAANTLHPVAAQGFNLGLRDAADLAQLLMDGKELKDYANLRQIDHRNTRFYTNSLVELFSRQSFVAQATRKLGLIAAQFIPRANREIALRGAGLCK